jgi:hypothetical protein
MSMTFHGATDDERQALRAIGELIEYGEVCFLKQASETPVTFTIFKDYGATRKKEHTASLAELREGILKTAAPTKAELPWLKLARFGEKKTKKGSLRNDDNVLEITGIELDYDGKQMSLATAASIIEYNQLRCLLYTSPSYTETEPKWRILCPTSKALPPGERERLARGVDTLFGNIFSVESFTLSQSYYFGSVSSNGIANPVHQCDIFDGDFVDELPLPPPPAGKAKTDGKGGDDGKGGNAGDDGGRSWGALYDDILSGRSLHPALCALAAKYLATGMSPGAAVNALYGLMDQSAARQNERERWEHRRGQIPNLVDTAFEKFHTPEPQPKPEPHALDEVHEMFRKWLDQDYDLDALDAVLAAAAAEKLTGDPLWLLLISGPGGAKTETVGSLEGAGAHVTSTIASEGALLSAVTPKKAMRKAATGGLLRKIGDRGILVIKDVTSILSADRNIRGTVLAALREVYDGKWERNVGSEGGQTLTWKGRIVIIGAVTTAWDTHHAVVAALGDRFVLIRMDSYRGRSRAAQKSISNTGDEVQMREELRTAVGGLLAHARTDEVKLTAAERDQIARMADIVTMSRTAAERDYKGDITEVHAPEMPTRFAKQLTQVVRGGVSIGLSREEAMLLAVRCARDSIPPGRLEILLDIAKNPNTRISDVRKRINKPWKTTKREMDALQMLGMLECTEEKEQADTPEKEAKTVWLYNITPDFDVKTLREMAALDPTEWTRPYDVASRRARRARPGADDHGRKSE